LPFTPKTHMDDEKQSISKQKYYQEKKSDPEFLKQRRENNRAYYTNRKNDPEFKAKQAENRRNSWKKLSKDPVWLEAFYKKRAEEIANDPIRRAKKNAHARQWRRSSMNTKLLEAKKSATQRGLEWSLTDEEACAMFTQPCWYCGRPGEPFNGIDRKDNTLGYTTDNSVSCCWIDNRSKHVMSAYDYIAQCSRVSQQFAVEL
jgi:ribosomal protein L22